MQLKSKTALITGGNRGVGLATARLFLKEGARVVITGRDEATLNAASADLGKNVLAIQADVTDIEALDRAITSTLDSFGKFDVIFASAGIGRPTPIGNTSLALFEEIIRTNLTSVFFTVQTAAPHLHEGASIILNGSITGVVGAPGTSAYAASKAGLQAMTRTLAAEFASRNIRVNQVTPGIIRTPIWSQIAPTDEAMAILEHRLLQLMPLSRMIDADDVAKTALYLASDASSAVTGTEIVVDGGLSTAPYGAPATVGSWMSLVL